MKARINRYQNKQTNRQINIYEEEGLTNKQENPKPRCEMNKEATSN